MGHLMMEILIFLTKILIIFLLSLAGFYFALLIPLAKERQYRILSKNSQLTLAKKQLLIEDIVKLFKPIILQSISLRGPEPIEAFYEVICSQEPYIYVIYRFVWPDEIHPNLLLHFFYKIFRIFYFGSFKDIELIQVKINLETTEIEEIKYETDSSNNPDVIQSDHAEVKLAKILGKNNYYQVYLNEVATEEMEIIFQERRPLIPVLSWNHVFALVKRNEEYRKFDLPVTPLSGKKFKKYRFDRRSGLDFSSTIDKTFPLKIGLATFVITALISSLLLFMM